MREALFFLVFILGQISLLGQGQRDRELYDLAGRMILDANGKKINYREKAEQKNFESFDTKQEPGPTAPRGGPIYCDPIWNFTVMGRGIGAHSLRSLDIDHDGKLETIASAYSNGYYFYTIQYNASRQTYEQSWVSPVHYYRISVIKCIDLNNDSIFEILVGFSNGDVLIYDGSTKKVTSTFKVPAPYGIYDIEYGDADNDGTKELVFCDILGVYFADATTHVYKNKLSLNGTYDLAIGDVDGDTKNELVLSGGAIIKYNGSSSVNYWTYETTVTPGGQLELSDIDQDGILEVIKADQDSLVHVYDADKKLEKYAINTHLSLGAIAVYDINNDGVDEIFFGDGQWGEVHCYDAASHTQMWSITNPAYGVSAISIGDGDADGNLEVFWGSGQSGNGGDTLYVYDVTTYAQEWKSKAIDGPLYGFRIADVDNDGNLEIVVASLSSVNGLGSSIITVFDASTHDIEWQSDHQLLPNTLTRVYDLEVADLDNDSMNEIIIAANDNYTGAIWIIDGNTKTIKSSHIYSSEGLSQFYTLDVADADGDGQLDIIAVNDQVRIIDPNTFAVKWSYPAQWLGYMSKVMVDNVDTDSNPEIVVMANANLYIFDGVTHQSTQMTATVSYRCFDLFDMDGDQVKEIVCGTYYGGILINNLVTQQVTNYDQVSPSYMDGIHVTLLNDDTIPEILFTSGGILYFRTSLGAISHFGAVGTGQLGIDDAIQTIDVDSDGNKEVFVGGGNRIFELGSACQTCLWFGVNVTKTNVSCISSNDGSIALNVVGGGTPYIYTWETGASGPSLSNLPVGTYSFSVSEQGGCSVVDSVIVQKAPPFYTNVGQNNVTCQQPNAGSLTAYPYSGTPPYHYNWSTSDTTAAITGLSVGQYTLAASDAAHCVNQRSFTITTQSITVTPRIQNISCTGDTNGSIIAEIMYGQQPYTYQWSNGQTGPSISDLRPGLYGLVASDGRGCVYNDTFLLQDPAPLTVSVSTKPDDLLKSGNDGSAQAVASGGTAPYFFNWQDPLMQSDSSAILLASGTYMLVVHDANNCRDTVSVQVGTRSDDIYVFPNPAVDFIVVRINNPRPAILTIRNSLGQEMIDPIEFIGETRVNTGDLSMGTYLVYVEQEKNLQNKKVVLGKKP